MDAVDVAALAAGCAETGSLLVSAGDSVGAETVDICLEFCDVLVTTRSTPGTIAAGTGGVAGSGDIGSRVGNSGGRTSGSLL